MKNLTELNDFIESKNDEVYELEQKIEQLERAREIDNIKWQLPEGFIVDDLRKGLPFPRIEMRIQKEGHQAAWIYGIVCRKYASNDMQEQVFMPISKTTTSESIESLLSYKDKLPLRDGVHVRADMIAFNMRGFLVCLSVGFLEEIETFKDAAHIVEKVKLELTKL